MRTIPGSASWQDGALLDLRCQSACQGHKAWQGGFHTILARLCITTLPACHPYRICLIQVLVLAPSERQHLTAGKLFNLVSSDANTLNDFCANAFGFISAPLRIVITMVMLWR